MTDFDLRALVDSVPGVILYQVVHGADGSRRCTYMSAGVERVIGITAAQVMTDLHALDAMIVEEDLAQLRAVTESAHRTLSPYETEIRARTVEGDLCWLHCRAIPKRRQDDGAVIADGILVDVTARRRAEEALREREALLSSLGDNLPAATLYQVVRRPDGSNYFPYISTGQADLYGLTREQVMADASLVYALLVGEDLKKLRAAADESLRTLMPLDVECRQRTLQGEERWVQIRARPRRLPDGSTLWDAISLDITDRKRAEAVLEERETQLRNLGDNIAGGVVYQVVRRPDGSNHFPYMSAGMEQVFGLRAGEAMNDPDAVYRLIHPEDLPRLRAAGDESIRTSTPLDGEYRLRTPSGEDRWMHIRGRPRPFADGSTLWDAVAIDVTDRHRLEEERRRLEAQLAEARRLESLEAIAGGIAHDFNNLLAATLGSAEMIGRALPPDSDLRESAARIAHAAARGGELTQQMLIYAGRAMWRPGRVSLSEIAADVIPAFRRGLTPEPSVRLELGPAVPDVHADSEQMRQAILSVLANAQEASVGAPAAIVVRTGIRYLDRAFLDAAPVGLELPEGDYAFLEVEDAGIGMDDVTRSRMFDPFFSTKFLGRGLGLAAVLGILRIHRGTVDVWTREGHGTRLTLFLPVVHQMGDI